MVKRQFPNPLELAELMKFKKPTMNPTTRRLDKALTIADLRDIAKRRTPKAPFDYTEGAAEGEISLKRARQAFEDVEFHPSILRDVSNVDTTREILGGPTSMPFGIAPTGFTRMMQTEGEEAGAGAAGAAGIPFTLSTMGTTSIEGVKAANPNGRNWFQLYVMRDRERSFELVRRAATAGFDTLFFTVDTPVAGARHRDKRNGFSIPPQLTPGTVINALPRPAWWINFLTTPKLEFASLSSTGGTVGELIDGMFDPSISFADLDTIRSMWPGKIVVKGVQNVADARDLADRGVDGIVLSNHGGRQLDRAPIPFHLLPNVAREVGNDLEVHIDTGIMSGADIVASVALGADFTLIGRAYLYGLMAGGRRGVDKTIEILRSEIVRTMKLLEVSTLDELGPQHVTQLARLMPVARPVADAAAAAVESKPKTVRTPRATTSGAASKAASTTAKAKAGATAATTAASKAAPAAKKATAAKAPAKASASAAASAATKAAPKKATASKAPASKAPASPAKKSATASATPKKTAATKPSAS